MILLSIRFLAGRYHATPWGRHVNEGVPEWPPSPWRILRALISSWKRTLPEVSEDNVKVILSEMLEAPKYRLPPASLAHIRHYMPWDKDWLKKREAAKTMVFNTFVAVSKDEPVIVCWPNADLDEEHRETLNRIMGNVSYLGRSESWCSIELLENETYSHSDACMSDKGFFNVCPVDAKSSGLDYEAVPVLVPSPDIDMSKPLDESHPFLVRTVTLRENLNRIDPPESVWVEYARPRNCFEPVYDAAIRKFDERSVKVVRYLIDGKVLPSILDTLNVASVARVAAMSVYGGADERKSVVLSGRASNGSPLEGHAHAFYLPSDEDGDGRLDHLTLYAPMGVDGEHKAALAGLDRLYGYGLNGELRLMLLGMQEEPNEIIDGGVFGFSSTWVSATPYLLTRYPKLSDGGHWRTTAMPEGLRIQTPEHLGVYPTKEHLLLDYGVLPDLSELQQDGPVAQLLLSCRRRGLPDVVEVEPVPEYNRSGRSFRWIEFKRYRRGGSKPVIGKSFGFKVTFKEPVMGPLALGYGCHYGLGLLRLDDSC